MMKRLSGIILILMLVVIIMSACSKPIVGFDSYFTGFKSSGAYTNATAVLNLKDFEEFYKEDVNGEVITKRNIYITSYEATSDVYIISESFNFDGTNYTINGFCTENELLIEPKYISVLSIKGDYAIVTKLTAVGSEVALRVGMVKFRGENKGYEYGFSYNYAIGIIQYTFLDDKYMVMLGHKSMTESGSPTSTGLTFTYATVYDYTSANGKALLEVARINNVRNDTTFSYNDKNVLTSTENTVRFYNLNSINEYGYLNQQAIYNGFDETHDSTYISNSIYYLGNDWYIITSTYTETQAYDSYEMVREQNDTSYYIKMKSVRYNVRYYNSYETDRVAMVGNKYTDDLLRNIVNSSNSTENVITDADEVQRTAYSPPVIPPSSLVKDGYSIVYYYFAFYSDGVRDWAMSFSIYDERATRIELKDIAMPLIFVDGIGLQNGDPNFNVPVREAESYTFYNKRNVFNDVTETVAYDTYFAHSDMIMAYRMEFITDYPFVESFMGAYDKNGNLAVPFRYYELTLFFGDYATGSIYEGTGDNAERIFYRVSKTGAQERIYDVYSLRDGLYITVNGENYGLKANDGTVLIDNKCEYVQVLSTYLVNGVFVENRVVTVEDGLGVLYKLS